MMELREPSPIPLAKPKGFPVKPVPAVKTAPLWKVTELPLAASNLCPPPVKVTLPEMLPVVPAKSEIWTVTAPEQVTELPASTWKSVPVPPCRVSAAEEVVENVTEVLPGTMSCPNVFVVKLFAVGVPPLPKTRMSVAVGALRTGLQLFGSPNSPVPEVATHV